MIATLSIRYIKDIELPHDTVNGNLFAHFVEHSLLPVLQPFNIRNLGSNCGHG